MNYLETYGDFVKNIAQESGKIIERYYRTKVSVDLKKDKSPVTLADRETETLIRERIMEAYPTHGILGEEFGEYQSDADYCWVIDPIDGTISFISGAMSFGTLIALTYKGRPVLGAFYHPIEKQFLIGDSKQSFLNNKPVRIREIQDISSATLLTTDLLDVKRHQNLSKFMSLAEQVHYLRMWGDCYGYFLLASGFADIMIDPIVNAWDIMALIPIIRGAGGLITDYQGNDAEKGNSIIAASPSIHDKIVKALN